MKILLGLKINAFQKGFVLKYNLSICVEFINIAEGLFVFATKPLKLAHQFNIFITPLGSFSHMNTLSQIVPSQ